MRFVPQIAAGLVDNEARDGRAFCRLLYIRTLTGFYQGFIQTIIIGHRSCQIQYAVKILARYVINTGPTFSAIRIQPSAKSSANVGVLNWSSTTFMVLPCSRFDLTQRTILLRLILSTIPYTKTVRAMAQCSEDFITYSSPTILFRHNNSEDWVSRFHQRTMRSIKIKIRAQMNKLRLIHCVFSGGFQALPPDS